MISVEQTLHSTLSFCLLQSDSNEKLHKHILFLVEFEMICNCTTLDTLEIHSQGGCNRIALRCSVNHDHQEMFQYKTLLW